MSSTRFELVSSNPGLALSGESQELPKEVDIELAFVSGRVGNAFFRRMDAWYELAVYSEELIPVASFRLEEILRRGTEYSLIRDISLRLLKQALVQETECSAVLFLLLALTDISVSISTRVLAAQSAECLLESDLIRSFAVNRLLSSALPIEQRATRQSVMKIVGEFPRCAKILHDVFESQPIIDQLHCEWDRAMDESNLASPTEWESELIQTGLFSAIVESVQSKDLQQMNAAVVASMMQFSALKPALGILRSNLASTFFGTRSPKAQQQRLRLVRQQERDYKEQSRSVDFISNLLNIGEHSEIVAKKLGALEAKARVDKQIKAIGDALFAGKNAIAEKYLGELLQFQLAQGDRDYLAMSLCSLTAIALDANCLDMAEHLSGYALKFGDNDVVAFTIRAHVLKMRGRFEAALNAYQETIHRFPGRSYPLNAYADVLQEIGRFREASERYAENQLLFPDDPVPFNGQVSVLKAQGRYHEALKAAIKVTKRFPYDSVSRATLAGCLSSLGKYGDAAQHYRLATQYDALNSRVASGYVGALRHAGSYQMAFQFIDNWRKKRGEDARLANQKATLLRILGKYDEALAIYSELQSKFPTYTPAKFGKAALNLLIGKAEDAIHELPTKSMESELDWAGFRTYTLALVATGHASEAVERLRWGLANCQWLPERSRIETALGFAEVRTGSSDAVNTLQKNIEKLESQSKQTRLILLGVAHAEAGRRDIANTIWRSIFNSRDPQLVGLNLAVTKFYSSPQLASSAEREFIRRQELEVVLAAA